MRRSRTRRVLKWVGTVCCALLAIVWLVTHNVSLRVNLASVSVWLGVGHLTVYHGRISDPVAARWVREEPGSWGLNWPRATDCYNALAPRCPYIGTLYSFPLWIPILVLVLPTALLYRYDRRLPRSGHCQRCGYNLTGNVSGRCPECGEPLSGRAGTSGALKDVPR
jgi:hypothetical protein